MNAFGISLAKEIQQIIATLEMIREMGWDWLSDHRSGRKIRLVLGPGRRVLVARDGFWHAHAWSLPSLRVVNWTSFQLQASDCFRHP